ncbi:FecCD family ABC transporter permease [Aureibacillus halotolerans]|uniref:Iron complex transport system permease protein n=1 Tax=Aureibacillus halotolerans TaxID=1508390 RepID=A0A4R6U0H4_9BACI|nr:iron ABC transporter permease [Aureibacillus halotolerans]TDQ36554.1 iron complex transport system permease protein [Aureibacillus halotolerans]
MRTTSKKQLRNRATGVLVILVLLILAFFVISMGTGFMKMTPVDLFKTLFGHGTADQALVLFEFRLPRIVISVLIGAGFAISGCILQAIARNPLSDPGILGINSGASLAVVLFISFYPLNQASPIFLLPVLALIGASVAAVLIYVLSYKKNEGIAPIRMILVGIGIAAGISALMIVLTIRLNPEQYKFVAVWMAGSIMGKDWRFVLAFLPWILLLFPIAWIKAKDLNVLSLGESVAQGLGARVEKERILLLLIAVGLAGASVAVGGGIGFVGLIAPHIARRLVSGNHFYLIPASALTGGLLLIVADTIARTIIQPSEIPTGVVVAVIGAPYFLYLMSKTTTASA